MDRTLAFAIVFLIPLIPAVIVGWAMGARSADASADGSIGGIKFKVRGAAATYVIFLALAYLGYRNVVIPEPQPQSYVLTLDLRGESRLRDNFLRDLNGFRVSFRDSANNEIVFSNFLIQSSRTSIQSTLTLPTALTAGPLSFVGLFPDHTVAFNAKMIQPPRDLRERMNGMLSIDPSDSNPLTRQDVTFSRDNWVITFQSVQDSFFVDGNEDRELVEHLVVFRNESSGALSPFALPGYIFDGDIVEFEGVARQLSDKVADANLIDFQRDPQLNGFDSDQVIEKIRYLAKVFSESGTELGYFKVFDSKLVSDPRRSERFHLGGKDTLVRGDPIAVDPGGVVAVVLRIKLRRHKTTIEPGKADHLGTFMNYPTRLLYLTVSSKSPDIRVGETTSRVDITNRDGTKSTLKDEGKFKKRGRNLIYTDWLLDLSMRVSVEWVWEKAN